MTVSSTARRRLLAPHLPSLADRDDAAAEDEGEGEGAVESEVEGDVEDGGEQATAPPRRRRLLRALDIGGASPVRACSQPKRWHAGGSDRVASSLWIGGVPSLQH